MEFKQTYTKEEAEELTKWMESCKASGPIQLRSGVNITNIQLFLTNNLNIVSSKYHNPNFAGQIRLVMELRSLLEQQAKEQLQPDSSSQ